MTTTSVSLNVTFATVEDMLTFLNKTGNGSDLPIQRIEAATPTPSTPQTELSSFDKLMIELNKAQWTLRCEEELRELIGGDPFELLDSRNVNYVTRTRRRDGARLIGLASRN